MAIISVATVIIKSILARDAVNFSAKPYNYVSKSSVVHIKAAFYKNFSLVNFKLISLLKVIVKYCRTKDCLLTLLHAYLP